MSLLRFEAWTYPGSATYEKRFEFSPVGGSGVRALSEYSDERVTLPADYASLDSIISASNRSTVKVIHGTTVIDEFSAERVRKNLDRPGFVDVTGIQRNGWIEGVGVYPRFDIEGAQDWHWGSENNRLRNPSGEDNPLAITNPGFEDGTVLPWRAGAVAGVSANLVIESTIVDTGSFAAKCTPLLAEGGMSTDVQLFPGHAYTVTFRFRGAAGVEYDFGAHGPTGITAVAGSTTLIDYTDTAFPGFEARKSINASGAYQTVAISFITGPTQSGAQINIREGGAVLNGSPFYVDNVSISGYGIGVEPWQASSGVITLEASQDVSHPDTSWVIKCIAAHGAGCYQGFVNNIPGEPVWFKVDVQGTAADLWTVELRDVQGQVIAQEAVTLSVGSWTTVVGQAILPDFIPGADNEIQLWLVNHSGATSTIYFAKALVAQGDPPATYTEIVGILLDDAHSRGTATWLELDADDTQDTLGTALSDISFSAFTGDNAHMGHVMADGRDIGYHWRIVPAADAQIITPTGTHIIQIFKTDDGEIEDLTTVPGGEYIFAGAVAQGEVVDRIPPFTALLALGEGGSSLEDTEATEVAAIGRIERVRDVEHLPASSLQFYLNAALAEEAKNRQAAKAEILGSARKIPGVDFAEGSKVWWQLPGLLAREARTVRRWTWTHASPARFEVQGSEVLTPEAAQAKAIEHLLNVLERRRLRQKERQQSSLVDSFGGQGGAPTVVVAASDASEISKRKADIICVGVNDDDAIRNAMTLMTLKGGRVLLTEGTFELGTSTLFTPDVPITIQGMGASTILNTSATGTVIEFIGDGSGIRDLVIIGTSTSAPSIFVRYDDSGWADNVIVDSGAVAFDLQGAGYVIRNCGSHDVPVFVDGSAFGSDVLIEGNGFIDAGPSTVAAAPIGRIILGASADNWTIVNNNMVGGIEDSGQSTNQIIIADNTWESINYISSSHAIIDLAGTDTSHTTVIGNIVRNGGGNPFIRTGSDPVLIIGNNARGLDDGILIAGSSRGSIILGNSLEGVGIGIAVSTFTEFMTIASNFIEADEHGISLANASHYVVEGNTIYRPGLLTHNTFDGIFLSADTDDNLIIGNKIFVASTGNRARYGINISAATCNNNAVYANYLGASANYGTADSVDSGTGTQTAPTAGVIGGQFAF